MPVNQTQTVSSVFAILTLFVASASGQQQWGASVPAYQPDEGIFDSEKVSEDVSAFFKSGIEDEIRRPEDSKPVARQASLQRQQSLIDKDGYLLGTAGGGIWSDFPARAATPAAPRTPATNPAAAASKSATPATPASLAKPTTTAPSPPPSTLPAAASQAPVIPPTPEAAAADLASGLAAQVGEGQGGAIAGSATRPQGFDQPAASADAVGLAPILAASPAQYAEVTPGNSKFRLRLGFDVLLWERGQPNGGVFATDDFGQQASFSDFDLTDGTARYIIQYMGDDLSGFEFTFFDFNTFSSSINFSGSNVLPLFFNGLPADDGDEFDLNYNSRLKNVEFNWWLRHNQIQRSGWGIRHINLDENFDVIAGRGNTGLFSRTDNDLWGFNRMWERRRPWGNRLEFTGGIDAGLYLNNAQIDVDTENIDDFTEERNLAGSLGFNLGLEYRVADHVTLRAGYEGLALFGVALASTQSLEQELVNGLDDPILDSIFFGGFHFGAIATF